MITFTVKYRIAAASELEPLPIYSRTNQVIPKEKFNNGRSRLTAATTLTVGPFAVARVAAVPLPVKSKQSKQKKTRSMNWLYTMTKLSIFPTKNTPVSVYKTSVCRLFPISIFRPKKKINNSRGHNSVFYGTWLSVGGNWYLDSSFRDEQIYFYYSSENVAWAG